jgi:hypothetical protein
MTYIPTNPIVRQLAIDYFDTPFQTFLTTSVGQQLILGLDERSKINRYSSILAQGRVDFTQDYRHNGTGVIIPANDLAVLYAWYYFQMHYSSAVAIFKILTGEGIIFNPQNTLLIDIGCGSMTAGIAFAAHHLNNTSIQIHYVGIDRATSMLQLASRVVAHDLFDATSSTNFLDDVLALNKLTIPTHIDTILFMFSFITSSRFLPDNFFAPIQALINRETDMDIHIIQQNPVGIDSNIQWNNFVNQLQGFEMPYRDHVFPYSYDNDLLGNCSQNRLAFNAKMNYFYKKQKSC